jgi:hypothetical protein
MKGMQDQLVCGLVKANTVQIISIQFAKSWLVTEDCGSGTFVYFVDAVRLFHTYSATETVSRRSGHDTLARSGASGAGK